MKKSLMFALLGILIFEFTGIAVAATVSQTTQLKQGFRKNSFYVGVRPSLWAPYNPNVQNDEVKDVRLGADIEGDVSLFGDFALGLRLGYISRRYQTTGSSINANYNIVKISGVGKYYILGPAKREYSESLSDVDIFVSGELGYYVGSKSQDFIAKSPDNYTGYGVGLGVGLELYLGRRSVYGEVGYQRTSIATADKSSELPLDGLFLAAGLRMGIF